MRLSLATLPPGRLIGASAPDKTGIVHFGLGNFHRAHQAVNTALALAAEPGDWGILGVANRSRTVVDALEAQDHLYSVVTLDPGRSDVGVVDVHRRTLVAAEDGPELLAAVADPAHRIVTLTVSEAGYHLDARTNRLRIDAPDVAADLAAAGRNARTPLAQLGFGLLRRFYEGGAPITVLSCDNLLSAGTTARNAVTQFLQAASASDDALAWLEQVVAFPNAMVDRIVPAPTEATRAAAAEALGVEDLSAVPAELFTMWVIEDHFPAGRPRWEAAPGVVFSDEVEKYEQVKLRLLNGGHSLIAYLGGLDARETIPESRAQDFIEACTRIVLTREYLPSIDLPQDFDSEAYIGQLFSRWGNTVLGDKTARVGSDGSTKLLQRVPIPAIRMLEGGRMPHQLALTVAGWICCTCPPAGFDPGPIAAAMVEPKVDALRAATAGTSGVPAHVEAILRGGFFPDELVAHDDFVVRVTELVRLIVIHGVRVAAADALAS